MPATHSTSGSYVPTSGISPRTASINVGTGTGNRAILVSFYNTDADDAATAITVGGETLTLLETSAPATDRQLTVWGGLITVTGTQTLSMTMTGDASYSPLGLFAVFDDVSATPFGTPTKNSGTSTAPSVGSDTCPTDGLLVGFMAHFYNASNATYTGSGTSHVSTRLGGGAHALAVASRSTTGGHSWSTSSSQVWSVIMVPLSGVSVAPTLTGSITLADLEPTGELGLNPSGMTGNVTLDAIAPTGTLGIAPGSVTTLPFSRNTGSRPTGLSGVAVAILSDDANLTRLAGATSLSQDGSGRINYTGAGLPSVGTSVLVVTREADGRLGLERYTVQ